MRRGGLSPQNRMLTEPTKRCRRWFLDAGNNERPPRAQLAGVLRHGQTRALHKF
jgi:hypothetical protein